MPVEILLDTAADGPAVPEPVLMTVADEEGSYTIPHIQTGRGIELAVRTTGPRPSALTAALRRGRATVARRRVAQDGTVRFEAPGPGEYAVSVEAAVPGRPRPARACRSRIGVGSVCAAVGDSITEGYFGRAFLVPSLDLASGLFPPESVSRDGRNFPQFAPTARAHLPSANCFESWMTRLNDLLSRRLGRPVFVANEGWGGITARGYRTLVASNAAWRSRMRLLAPDVWLVHLGVNDGRAGIPPAAFRADMAGLVRAFVRSFGASPGRIFVAKPSYDAFPGAERLLAAYREEIDRLVAGMGLRPGPDFRAAYAAGRRRWYGTDPVHPNIRGMARMARLWCAAVAPRTPQRERPS